MSEDEIYWANRRRQEHEYAKFVQRIIDVVRYHTSDYKAKRSCRSRSVYIYVGGMTIRCSDHKYKGTPTFDFGFLSNEHFHLLELRKRLRNYPEFPDN